MNMIIPIMIISWMIIIGGAMMMIKGEEGNMGYEYLDDDSVLHFWNENDDYYIDVSSGIQLTNHYDEYWSHNIFCGGFKIAGEWEYYCNDDLPFAWSIDTDNSTYFNYTGYKDVTRIIAGGEFTVRFAVRYNLKPDDEALIIQPYAKNIGDLDIPVDLGFAWRVNDIQISADQENDFIWINDSMYWLNETLDMNFTSLPITEVWLEDSLQSESLWFNWSGNLNYKLTVNSTPFQYNAPITLMINAGSLDIGQDKTTIFEWIDGGDPDECIWSCTMTIPSSQVTNIFINQTYTQIAGVSTSPRCPSNNIDYYVQTNQTDGVWVSMNTTTNLTTPTNPLSVTCEFGHCGSRNFIVTGAKQGLVGIRNKCVYTGVGTKYSPIKLVNVTKDIIDPVIILLSPSDTFNSTNLTNDFICNVSDISGIANVSLWANWSNLWHEAEMNTSGVNNANYTFSIYLPDDYQNTTGGYDFTESGNAEPYDSYRNGTDTWIVDLADKFVYHYNSSGDNQTDGYGVPCGLSNPVGIHGNATHHFILDYGTNNICIVDASSGQNITPAFTLPYISEGFSLDGNGTHFATADDTLDEIVVFNSTWDNVTAIDISAFGVSESRAIVMTGNEFIVIGRTDGYRYRTNMSGTLISKIYNIRWGNGNVFGMSTTDDNNNTDIFNLYQVDSTDNYVYHLQSEREGIFEWNCLACDSASNCAWADSNRTINISIERNSCDYPGSGSWNINGTENCTVDDEEPVNVQNNNIAVECDPDGEIYIQQYIINWTSMIKDEDCIIIMENPYGFI